MYVCTLNVVQYKLLQKFVIVKNICVVLGLIHKISGYKMILSNLFCIKLFCLS